MVKTLQCDGLGALKFDSWAVVVVHMYVHTGKGRSQVYTSTHICITKVHMCHVPCMTKYLSLLWRHSHLTGFIQIRNVYYTIHPSSWYIHVIKLKIIDDRDTLIFKKKNYSIYANVSIVRL